MSGPSSTKPIGVASSTTGSIRLGADAVKAMTFVGRKATVQQAAQALHLPVTLACFAVNGLKAESSWDGGASAACSCAVDSETAETSCAPMCKWLA